MRLFVLLRGIGIESQNSPVLMLKLYHDPKDLSSEIVKDILFFIEGK
jgi:hypothetical protein